MEHTKEAGWKECWKAVVVMVLLGCVAVAGALYPQWKNAQDAEAARVARANERKVVAALMVNLPRNIKREAMVKIAIGQTKQADEKPSTDVMAPPGERGIVGPTIADFIDGWDLTESGMTTVPVISGIEGVYSGFYVTNTPGVAPDTYVQRNFEFEVVCLNEVVITSSEGP